MKTKLTSIRRIALLLLLLSTLNPQPSTQAQGTAFTYQGRLNSNGATASGWYDLQLALFDAPTGGFQIGGTLTTNAVPVSNGLFTVTLDFGAGVFTGANRWLNLAVRTNGAISFTPLTPPQQITAAPYAITAGTVTGVIPAASLSGLYTGPVTMNNPGNVFNGALFAGVFTGNGAGLTGVNASTLGGLSTAGFWKTNGNTGANPTNGAFLGTADNLPLEFKVNGSRALRLEPTTTPGVVNVIGGWALNSAAPGAVGATIAGGGIPLFPNTITASYATIGGGTFNSVAGGWSTIGGGRDHNITGNYSTVSGGSQNSIQTNADFATVGGGVLNVIQPQNTYATIGGGRRHLIESNNFSATVAGGEKNIIHANASYSFIGGGLQNSAASESATISGGNNNNIQSNSIYGTIGGGANNTVRSNAWRGTVGGGVENTVSAPEGTVVGGAFNSALGFSSTIGGGGGNLTSGEWSTVAGGRENRLTNANYATISGGLQNTIQTNADFATIGGGGVNTIQTSGHFATIPGGRLNSATNYAFAAGTRAKANHSGAFVWADSTDADFSSATANQFLIRAGGGVGINTTATFGAALTVNGEVAATSFRGDGRYLTGVALRDFGNQFTGDQSISGNLTVSGSLAVGGSASAGFSAAAIGFDAQAGGNYATAIGEHTRATANYGMALGFGSQADHTGSFVWADATVTGFASTANNQFLIRAGGGVGINTASPGGAALAVNGLTTSTTARINGANNWNVTGGEGDFRVGNDSFRFKIGVANGGGGAGDVWMRAHGGTARVFVKTPGGTIFYSNEGETAGVSLAAGGTAWAVISDRNVKKDFAPVDSRAVLEKLAAMPITQWHYQWESADVTPHLGPMAQDFKAAFYPGSDDKSITTQEADGVALAAIQGLNQKVDELKSELNRRDAENAALKMRLERLEQLLAARDQNP